MTKQLKQFKKLVNQISKQKTVIALLQSENKNYCERLHEKQGELEVTMEEVCEVRQRLHYAFDHPNPRTTMLHNRNCELHEKILSLEETISELRARLCKSQKPIE
tara:strand:- start:84 stop:398 length:315 start_codon:yes stop_codon:yes gene_type:complete